MKNKWTDKDDERAWPRDPALPPPPPTDPPLRDLPGSSLRRLERPGPGQPAVTRSQPNPLPANSSLSIRIIPRTRQTGERQNHPRHSALIPSTRTWWGASERGTRLFLGIPTEVGVPTAMARPRGFLAGQGDRGRGVFPSGSCVLSRSDSSWKRCRERLQLKSRFRSQTWGRARVILTGVGRCHPIRHPPPPPPFFSLLSIRSTGDPPPG